MWGIKSRRMAFILGIVTLLGVVGLSATWLTLGRSEAPQDSIPANIQAAVDFPLLYPDKLPIGYTINPDSFSATKEVVTYSIIYEDGNKLLVSMQPLPPAFDFEDFYQSNFKNTLSLTTANGVAKIGTMNGTRAASLLTGKTWLLITAPNGIDDGVLQGIIKSFNPVKPRP